MRILLFGATGQVGGELRSLDWGFPVEITAPGRHEADVAVPGDAGGAVQAADPDLVINASAYTAVDRAESEPDRAMAVNCAGPGEMAGACADASIPLIHISTDFVFDGAKDGAYSEDDPVNPLGIYGRTKESGERAVREALDRHIILRTAWVFSAHGQNFVKTMLRLGGERDALGVVDDQRGCPTSAATVAGALAIITRHLARDETIPWGTYHFCGAGDTTWYGFARAIFELAEPHMPRRPDLKPIATADYPTPARRPANSVLACAKIEAAFGVEPRPWRKDLAAVIEQLFSREDTVENTEQNTEKESTA